MRWHSKSSKRHSHQQALWHATAGEVPAGDAFEPGMSVDVAVVGAGITGATAALHLQKAGANVALVEAGVPGAGATGRSGGFVVPSFSAVRPGSVYASRGEAGEKLLRAVAGSADCLFDLMRTHGIDCEGVQAGWFHPAHSNEALERIAEDAGVWQSVGGRITLLDAIETERRTGVSGYAGSFFATGGGTINPVMFVHGMIRAAMAAGLKLCSSTPALSLSRDTRRWRLGTTRGDLYADRVLVCTNGRTPELFAASADSIVPLTVCQIATSPLAESQRARLLGQGQGLSDTRLNLFSYRFDPQWRLISGAMPVLPFRRGRHLARRIAARVARQLGVHDQLEIEHVWIGEASITADRLPVVHQIGPGAFAAVACNGRGLAMSVVMGQSLARMLDTGRQEELPVSITQPHRVASRGLQRLGARLYPVYGQLRDMLSM